MAEDTVVESAEKDVPQPEWAVVEIMGHRRHAGLCQEVQRFGSAMLRVDVYATADVTPRRTYFYGGAAIFSYSLCSEASARRIVDYELEQVRPAQGSLTFRGEEEY